MNEEVSPGGSPGSAAEEGAAIRCVECGREDDEEICLAHPLPRAEGDAPVEICETCAQRFVFTDAPKYTLIGARKLWLDSEPYARRLPGEVVGREAAQRKAQGIAPPAGGSLAGGEAGEKPERCESCERRPATVKTTIPGHVSKLGLPLPVWLCAECVQLIPRTEPVVAQPKKKKRERVVGRMSCGKYGPAVMKLAYRFGGFSARQLGELLLLEDPSQFARSKGEPSRAARVAAAETLNLLRKNRLAKSVGIWRRHAVGERDGRIEAFYYLSGEGILWGAWENGVMDKEDALTHYGYHQLPRASEHAAYRNDVYLLMLKDFAEDRRRRAARGTLEEDAASVVVSGVEDFNGESYAGSPYAVADAEPKKGKWRETPQRRGRKTYWLYPDGHPRIAWADGLECYFEMEAERESETAEGADKVDRYAAHWLRVYKQMEDDWREPKIRALEEDIAARAERLREIEAELAGIANEGELARLSGEREEPGAAQARQDRRMKLLRERATPYLSAAEGQSLKRRLAEARRSRPPWRGLPAKISPVLFVHRTKLWSEGIRTRLRDGKYPMPRLDEFREYLTDVVAQEAETRESAASLVEKVVDSLFLFTSFEALQPEEGKTLGNTLKESFNTMNPLPQFEGGHTLRRAAWVRDKLRIKGEAVQ